MTTRTTWIVKNGARLLTFLLVALVVALLAARAPADASTFPGANGKIVFTSNRATGTGVNNPERDFEIFTMNPDGTGLKQITKNSETDAGASYSPDGKKIVFQSDRTGNFEVFRMNADGTGQTNLTKNPASDVRPSFSPNGEKILFDSPRGGNPVTRDIFIMNADGTQQTPLTSDPAEDSNATFSPGGNKIAFVSRRSDAQSSTDRDIFTMLSNGTAQTRLTDNTFEDDDPSFAPDGNRIAFASNRFGGGDFQDFDILVMGADGSSPTNFTGSTATDDHPAFSPNGKQIAFSSTRNSGDEDIFTMNATNGTNQTDITQNQDFDSDPDWQPVGATFTVTTATDLGDGACDSQCTLREAINTSNQIPGSLRDTIRFNIPGSGVQTITPLSVLPPITRPVTIDGYTQPGASPNTLATGDNAVLKIELNGTNISGANGLTIVGTSGNSLIRGLVINRFGTGIAITGDTVGNRVEGNFIGTDPTGTTDQGNAFDAVAVFNGPSGNVIGGTTPASRNILSGNDDTGIFVNEANVNTIQGNYVGTDKNGTKALGNTDDGIALRDAFGTTVGGTTVGAGNLISGNPLIGLDMSGSNGTKVLGNRIGTTANGTGSLPNTDSGVFLSGSNYTIGNGTATGANTIAFNGEHGVEVGSTSSQGNTISRNSVFSNAGIGINLSGGFEDASSNTPNEPGDLDSGPNNLQNFPVLSSAKSSSTQTTITGKLSSTPTKTFVLQFFSNPSGNEGKTFIAQKSVTTGSSGDASFTFSPATKVAVGQTITATATDSAGNTSEFSAPRTVALASGSNLTPETTKVSGPSGVTGNRTAHFKFSSPDPDADFECSLDGAAYYECSSPENVNRLSEGRHTFKVRAVDEQGNPDPSPAVWIWAVGKTR